MPSPAGATEDAEPSKVARTKGNVCERSIGMCRAAKANVKRSAVRKIPMMRCTNVCTAIVALATDHNQVKIIPLARPPIERSGTARWSETGHNVTPAARRARDIKEKAGRMQRER